MEFLNYWHTVSELCHFYDDKSVECLTYVVRQDRLKKTNEAKRLTVHKLQSKLKEEIYNERTCKKSASH